MLVAGACAGRVVRGHRTWAVSVCFVGLGTFRGVRAAVPACHSVVLLVIVCGRGCRLVPEVAVRTNQPELKTGTGHNHVARSREPKTKATVKRQSHTRPEPVPRGLCEPPAGNHSPGGLPCCVYAKRQQPDVGCCRSFTRRVFGPGFATRGFRDWAMATASYGYWLSGSQIGSCFTNSMLPGP